MQTTDPVVIAQAMEDTVDPVITALEEAKTIADQMVERFVVVDIPEVVAQETAPVAEQQQREPGQDDEEVGAVAQPHGYPVMVPGKEEPASTHATLDEWQDAYEDMADKIARAGKRPPRERMTILREFKEANEETLKRVDLVKRIRHTANYSKRLAALGAAQ
jgi:D-alanine-D-alanine ligase-like ATP-grasp enzyme